MREIPQKASLPEYLTVSAVHLVYHFSSFHSLFKSSKTIENVMEF